MKIGELQTCVEVSALLAEIVCKGGDTNLEDPKNNRHTHNLGRPGNGKKRENLGTKKTCDLRVSGIVSSSKGIKLINDENVTNKIAADILQKGHRN
jgi:hypothetical protein